MLNKKHPESLEELRRLKSDYLACRSCLYSSEETIVGRETQKLKLSDEILRFLGRESDKQRQSSRSFHQSRGAIYVYGPPGTGKTAVIRSILREVTSTYDDEGTRSNDDKLLATCSDNNQVKPCAVEINAAAVRSINSAHASLIEVLKRILLLRGHKHSMNALSNACKNQTENSRELRSVFFKMWHSPNTDAGLSLRVSPTRHTEISPALNGDISRKEKRKTSSISEKRSSNQVKSSSSNLPKIISRKRTRGNRPKSGKDNQPDTDTALCTHDQSPPSTKKHQPETKAGNSKRMRDPYLKSKTQATLFGSPQSLTANGKLQQPQTLLDRTDRHRPPPCIIFIDEIEALCRRMLASQSFDPVVELYKIALTPESNMFLIGCSNSTEAPFKLKQQLEWFNRTVLHCENQTHEEPEFSAKDLPGKSCTNQCIKTDIITRKSQTKAFEQSRTDKDAKSNIWNANCIKETTTLCFPLPFVSILFPAYTKRELSNIVKCKISKVSKNQAVNRLHESTIDVMALHMEKTTGDCRAILDGLCRSVDERLVEISSELNKLEIGANIDNGNLASRSRRSSGSDGAQEQTPVVELKTESDSVKQGYLSLDNSGKPKQGRRSLPPPPLNATDFESVTLTSSADCSAFHELHVGGSPLRSPETLSQEKYLPAVEHTSTTPSTVAPSTPQFVSDADIDCPISQGIILCSSADVDAVTKSFASLGTCYLNENNLRSTQDAHAPDGTTGGMELTQTSLTNNAKLESNYFIAPGLPSPLFNQCISPIEVREKYGSIGVEFAIRNSIQQVEQRTQNALTAKIESIPHIDRLCLYAIWSSARQSFGLNTCSSSKSSASTDAPSGRNQQDSAVNQFIGGSIDFRRSSAQNESSDSNNPPSTTMWSQHGMTSSNKPAFDAENVSPNCLNDNNIGSSRQMRNRLTRPSNVSRQACGYSSRRSEPSDLRSGGDEGLSGFPVKISAVEEEVKRIIEKIDPLNTLLPASHSSFLGAAIDCLTDLNLISTSSEGPQYGRSNKLSEGKKSRDRLHITLRFPLDFFNESRQLKHLWQSIEERYATNDHIA